MNTQQYDSRPDGRSGYAFAFGLCTGAVVGAGLAFWFAPRLAGELRERVTGSARDLGARVSDHYDQVSTRIVNAATELTRQGQAVRDEVADAIAHGAHEVERVAKASKTR